MVLRHFQAAWAVAGLLAFLTAAKAPQGNAQQPRTIMVRRGPNSGLEISDGILTAQPAEIELITRGEGARHGQLWVRSAEGGLYIAGKVEGEQPDFPHGKDQILSKDHVEVWLAGAPDFDLPDIGWGNQFEEKTLPKGPESCADFAGDQVTVADEKARVEKACREWAATQLSYRPYFKRLFLRQWLLAPDFAVESFATPAYEEIQKRFSNLGDKIPEYMKPGGKPQMFLFPQPSGYSFEIFLPFEAFPPLPSLRSGEIRLLVDVFRAAAPGKKMGSYSTSSPMREWSKAETFNRAVLNPPLLFQLTPCDLPLVGADKSGGYHPAWFFPGGEQGQSVADAFIVLNDPAGYRYEPAGLSPTVRRTHYFWKEVEQGEWVCGPHLTYKKGSKSETFAFGVGEEGFDTKRLADGELLIKTGPSVWYSEFGSGQCGGCPRTDLRIFELGKDQKAYQILELGDVIGGPPGVSSQDFVVSPDWSQVVEYDLKSEGEEASDSWSATTLCWNENHGNEAPHGHVFEKCGEKQNVQAPNPPVLKELRGFED